MNQLILGTRVLVKVDGDWMKFGELGIHYSLVGSTPNMYEFRLFLDARLSCQTYYPTC